MPAVKMFPVEHSSFISRIGYDGKNLIIEFLNKKKVKFLAVPKWLWETIQKHNEKSKAKAVGSIFALVIRPTFKQEKMS